MRLPLDDTWFIDCDDTCCTLIELRTITGENCRGRAPKPENIGKQREETHAYGSLEHMLQAYVRKRLQGDPSTMTAQQVLDHVNESMRRIAELVKCLKYEPTR